jgi:hypothetical protein
MEDTTAAAGDVDMKDANDELAFNNDPTANLNSTISRCLSELWLYFLIKAQKEIVFKRRHRQCRGMVVEHQDDMDKS